MRRKHFIAFVISIQGLVSLVPSSFAADPIGFSELWSRIRTNSSELEGEKLNVSIANVARQRASLHWLPSVSLGGRFFATDDPGLSLFSRLGTRQISAQDFGPATLNEPGFQNFGQVSLQAELPLYEGGIRESARMSASFWQESREKLFDAREVELHSRAAAQFGAILSLLHARDSAIGLQTDLERVLRRYSLGSKANPVGYSGLLGLKALKNRIASILALLSAEEEGAKSRISVLAGMSPDEWEPRKVRIEYFVNEALPKPSIREDTLEEEALRLTARGAEERAGMEKARYLPGVGFFGNENWNTGSRGSALSTTAGFYLRWSLFTPDSLNRHTEADLMSKRDSVRAKEASDKARSGFSEWSAKSTAIEENLKRIEESEELLQEQIRIAFRLFQDGALGALALAEVLNRRVDLLLDRAHLESGWIEGRSALQIYRKKEGF